jgi:hypothetical protein
MIFIELLSKSRSFVTLYITDNILQITFSEAKLVEYIYLKIIK